MSRFADKVVIITGATAGIGAATARAFATRGAKLVLVARSQAGLDRMRAELGESVHVLAISADLGEQGECERLIESTQSEFGVAHVLVNNAGVDHRGAVEELSVTALTKMIDLNLRAPIVLSRLVLPLMRRGGGGAIVNVASLAGFYPMADAATYSATKFGLRAFTRALAEELANTGITVSVVSPGPVATALLLDEIDTVSDIVFSQPMSSAEDIATLIVRCCTDGMVERTMPRMGGYLATLGYLMPGLRRVLGPVMERRGRRAKERWRSQKDHGRS